MRNENPFNSNVLMIGADSRKFELEDFGKRIKSKGYQNQAFGQNFGLGYSKEHVKNSGLLSYAKEIFLERPVWNYRYNESQYRSSLQIDTLKDLEFLNSM